MKIDDDYFRVFTWSTGVLSAIIKIELDKGNIEEAKEYAETINRTCKAFRNYFRAKDDLEQSDTQ